MDRPVLLDLDWRQLVDGLHGEVEDAAEDFQADGNLDGRPGIGDFHVAHDSIGRGHRHRSDPVAAEMLLHLEGQVDVTLFDLEGVVDRRQMALGVLGIEGRANHLYDLADGWGIAHGTHSSHSSDSWRAAGISLKFNSSPRRRRSLPGSPG